MKVEEWKVGTKWVIRSCVHYEVAIAPLPASFMYEQIKATNFFASTGLDQYLASLGFTKRDHKQ
jgi:hypothetical protein